MTTDSCDTLAPAPGWATPGGASCAVAACLLVLLLVTNVPLFLCLPLTDDAAMYDLQALLWLRGGVLYRDIVEPNLPGAVWMHAAARTLLGTSSIALRTVDLLLFSVVVVISRNRLLRIGATPATGAWLALVLFLCYFSFSEWCHCQRDVWLLLPGLAGLTLRSRQIVRWRASSRASPTHTEGTVGWAFLEGLCWGAGVWLKPMLLLPAFCVWLVSLLWIGSWRRSLVDLFGLVTGGLLMGGVGIAVLAKSGAWPYFLATLLEWNPRYAVAAREQWTLARYVAMQVRFFPWQLLHFAAIPVALLTIGRALRKWWKSRKVEESKSQNAKGAEGARADAPESRSLDASDSSTLRLFDSSTLCVFYLGWLLQSYLLQHLFDYVHAPAMLLAIVVLGGWRAGMSAASTSLAPCIPPRAMESSILAARSSGSSRLGRLARGSALVGFVALVLLTTPVVRLSRLSCWWTCVSEGSTAAVRDRLKYFSVPSWRDLERVAEYLQAHELADRELTCYHNSLVHLYGIMALTPSTRFVYLEQVVAFFPEQHPVILKALGDSRQRYVVTDLVASGLPPERIDRLCPEGVLTHPPRFPSRLREVYPWSQPAVFRAGPYLVHQIRPPLGRLESPRGSPAPTAHRNHQGGAVQFERPIQTRHSS